jgi:alkanesulfonate monooxygenase SsuD/methylene tetrahydromethanopterin reductase-like flavin-dependent oxidoreductase (luciferase family)
MRQFFMRLVCLLPYVDEVRVRIFVEPQQGPDYAQLLAVAQEAEALGFDAFFRSDHYLTMSGDGLPGPTDPGERFERLDEQLSIVTGLWDTPSGQTFSYAGRHYQLLDSPALPKPVQLPHPPVIVGDGGYVPYPPSGCHLRRRVQPGLPWGGRHRSSVPPGA